VNQGTRMGSIAGSRANELGTGRECRDVEVSSLSQRRRLTAAYQRRVWAEAEACTAPGQVDALLRREGLSASHLTTWRRPREPRVLEALTPNKRGHKAQGVAPRAQRVAPLERDHARLSHQRKQAETIIAVPKKVSALLGRSQEGNPPGGSLSWQPRGDERRTLAPGRLVMRWAFRAPAPIVISNARRARVFRSNGHRDGRIRQGTRLSPQSACAESPESVSGATVARAPDSRHIPPITCGR
jgi:transposase